VNTPARLGAYALGLAAVFGAATGLGSLVGPVGAVAGTAPHDGSHAGSPVDEGPRAATADLPGGLQVSQDGYTLEVARELPAGAAVPVSFRVLGPDGGPVTGYDVSHEEDLHLVAVRRDLSGYQHVHPEMAADGTWSVPLDLTAGTWRLLADLDPAGDDPALVLGADVAVAGDHSPQPLPGPSATAEVDGYTVTLDGTLTPGAASELTLSVSRAGQPVTDLQPYLAAYGHLVALRAGDLAHLHVHPAGEPGDGVTAPGPDVTFSVTAPSAGDYRLFLDFRHGDVVRTAEFTVRAGDPAPGTAPAPADDGPTDDGPTGDGHTDDGHAHG
jgi:hypothetical protein